MNLSGAAPGPRIGGRLIRLPEVGSTNTYALGLGEADGPHGTVVIAGNQTAGRGRMGRLWISPPGKNIAMSIILRPDSPRELTLLTPLAAVAFCRGLRAETGLPVSIKWPNDLLLRGKKVGGILSETKMSSSKLIVAVIGVGINVNTDGDDFPPGLLMPATSLMLEGGMRYSLESVADSMIRELDAWYPAFDSGDHAGILKEWRTLSDTLGRKVRISSYPEACEGIAEDIDDSGRLLLRMPSGELKTISVGDLAHLK